ncbi:MAG: molybdate ABC transporter substrate-binding protein [Xenococcus sp. MO_188.B8]|nr:molybdate ABC transporter substrate-binding protein [Xenococcus sp. MO_188.B8]
MIRRRKFIGISLLVFLSACTASGNNNQNSSVTLTISAAASLQDALQEIGKLYNQYQPNVNLIYNFGSSGSLRHQIEQGAPVDIFISADEQHMDALENKNLLLSNTRQNLLKNELLLITALDNSKITGFTQLKSNSVRKIAIGSPDSVPAGKYAKEVLESLKLYKSLKPKFVFTKDVRQVLTYVETGNVEAGIVYATDAQISKRVKVIATAPTDSHSPIIYPVAIARDSKNPETAQDFIQFLFSSTSKNIFTEYGFIN